MSIAVGSSIGSYQVTGQLGAGGMGVVYRARDTKLKRDVAIKALPETFASDADRVFRFKREAEVLASLNHPHIAAIYDLLETEGARFLVLELVEGETLAARVGRGRIPTGEAIDLARQIAEALETAHDKGIVHRDLKPSNVKITPDGQVKVLDFGLARVLEPDPASADVTQSPTMTRTTPGQVLLGTAPYMSPEQARGQEAGRLADVWAFGCVLFEMLTGRAAFSGDTATDVLGSVLKLDPDWTRLPGDTPAGVRRVLGRCLQKDRKRRLHDIADVRIELEDAAGERADVSRGSRLSPALWMAVGAIGLLAALGAAVALYVRGGGDAIEQRVDITAPPVFRGLLSSIAMSPDGTKLALVGTTDRGRQLWLRSLESGEAQPLPGTEGALLPFWSPSGQSIGFFADSALKRLDMLSGIVRTLADAPVGGGNGGTWSQDGVILFNAAPSVPLYRVPEAGGDRVEVTRLDPPRQLNHSRPQFLPDGRHFLYFVAGEPDGRGVYVGSLDSLDHTRLFDAEAPAVFMPPDRLLTVQQRTLFVRRFDAGSLRVLSDPVPVAQGVAAVTASSTGIVAYRSVAPGQPVPAQLGWFDRSGQAVGALGGFCLSPELSPDGAQLACFRGTDGNYDIWLIDVASGRQTRFTSDPAVEGFPTWSPDGTRIVFTSANGRELHWRLASGMGAEHTLMTASDIIPPTDWSSNGFLLFQKGLLFRRDHLVVRVSADGKTEGEPVSITDDPNFDQRDGKFSPDGRWIAYQSNETGRFEIYLVPFPSLDRKIPVTSTGGMQVRWRRDGRELFYVGLDSRLMTVALTPSANGEGLSVGTPTPLFSTDVLRLEPSPDINGHSYEVSPDGARFLLPTGGEGPLTVPINLILNWKPPIG
jgi:Tol biopolymer transport system component/tRNA A-37 threonylcarbamoyl transferase component Bud32